MMLLLFVFLCVSVPSTLSSRILFVPEWDSLSHIWSMMPYAKSLKAAGHNVTYLDINTETKARKYPDGIGLIHMNITEPPGFHTSSMSNMWTHRWLGSMMWFSYLKSEAAFKTTLDNYRTEFDDVLNGDWDLIVVDVMTNLPGYAIAEKIRQRNVPYIIYVTSTMFNSFGMAAAIVPWHIGVHSSLTGVPFSWERLLDRSSFIVTDAIDEFGHPQAEVQKFISAGAHCPEVSMTSLDEELKEFLDDPSSQGTIYVAFGSILNWKFSPPEVRQMFQQALNKLTEYRIIFVYPLDDLVFGSHVRTVKWANQAAILAHPKTKVFLSHGGLKSLRESLCSSVPPVLLPFFAEQAQNSRLARERGVALTLNKQSLTKGNRKHTQKGGF